MCPAGRNHAETLVGGAPGKGVRSGSRCRRRVRHGLELRGGLVGGRRRGGAGHGPERQQDQDQEEALRVPEGEAVPGLGAAAQRPHVGSQPHGERGPPGVPSAPPQPEGRGPQPTHPPHPGSSIPLTPGPSPQRAPPPPGSAAPFPAHPGPSPPAIGALSPKPFSPLNSHLSLPLASLPFPGFPLPWCPWGPCRCLSPGPSSPHHPHLQPPGPRVSLPHVPFLTPGVALGFPAPPQ